MTDVVDAGIVENEAGHCTRETCPANEGGVCALGIDPVIDCEEYQLGGDDGTDEAEPEPNVYRFPTGEALRPTQLLGVLAGQRPVIVAPLGDVDAGKTTLIALVHQLLCAGALERWRFAGSTTSVGFARRNFLASLRSKRATPKAGRTSRSESGHYLHLDMRSKCTDQVTRLLLADVSGEHVGDLRLGTVDEAVRESVGRADHIPILVSGAALAGGPDRPAQELATRTMLSMLEAHLHPTASFSVVVTKVDRLGGADADELAARLVLGTVAEGATVFRTADRPGGGAIRGQGVEELLDHLLASNPASALAPSPTLPEVSNILKRSWTRP